MPRHALDPSVAFGNDTESTIPWSSVSSSVAVLDFGPEYAEPFEHATYSEKQADSQPPRSGRHRKSGRSIFGDPRFHAGATLGLMGTIFLPQLSGSPGTDTPARSDISVEPEAAAAAFPGAPTLREKQVKQRPPKHALREPSESPEQQLKTWTKRNSKIGIPAPALRAYINAEHAMMDEQPSCKLRWNLLAGVGRIESNHGRFDGRYLKDNGQSSQKIIGIPLDGSAGVRAIYDTDGGEMDGDTTFDRAVGPMQFIPSTWDKWAEDGNGDGKADPHSIDDAALTAANYLCGHGSRLDTDSGQRAALYGYNNSYEYGQDVITHAGQYIGGVNPLPADINPRATAKHAKRSA